MPDWNAIQAFMAAAVPWPAEIEPGYINLHFSMPPKPGEIKKKYGSVPGWPWRDVQELINRSSWMGTHPNFKDQWFCLSRQKDTGPSKNKGKARALRNLINSTHMKALWVDIDFGKKSKVTGAPVGYQSYNEGLLAILQFSNSVGLPTPSAVVKSGGGLHVYWISKGVLLKADWLAYAQGLKNLLLQHNVQCDAGLTTDASRILRMPGSKNFKYDPPVEVVFDTAFPLTMYDFDPAFTFLQNAAGPVPQAAPAETPHNIFVDGITADKFKAGPSAVFQSLDKSESLSAGIEKHTEFLVSPAEVFRKCVFYRDALKTGGAHHSQPLWNLAVLGTTFMQSGEKFAHAISSKHPDYNEADTQALYDRKVAERSAQGIGYPSCAAFESNGSKHCATCPLFNKIKSPLNIRPVVTATVTPLNEPEQRGAMSSAGPNAAAGNHGQQAQPVARLMALLDQGASIEILQNAMNETFAVTKYGGQVVIASLFGTDISFITVDDFHRMFANLVIITTLDKKTDVIKVSKRWFEWKGRRQYLGRGVVFEPGGPLDVPDDMLNLWRGFGIAPKPGNWSLLRKHILKVVCAGNHQHFDYLIRLMAYRVQHLGDQTGVAVALLGPQGAGKGVLARTFGLFFGKHFAHLTQADHLTGRFNAALGTASVVFLDEALWAPDRKGEGVLKALITEPQFQLEAKFRDAIMVKNVLFIMVASNNEWAVPAGAGDRRWFVLDVATTYAGQGHQAYFAPLYAEIENGGAAAMLHELLAMDLSGFDVRAIPHTAAKAKQQALSLNGSRAWLYDVLQEGSISGEPWQDTGLTMETDRAYMCYVEFSKRQRDWKPEIKSVWSKNIQATLGPNIGLTRLKKGKTRVRSFQFAPLSDCRGRFAAQMRAPDLEWDVVGEPEQQSPEDISDCSTVSIPAKMNGSRK